jgi:hypothetical protein
LNNACSILLSKDHLEEAMINSVRPHWTVRPDDTAKGSPDANLFVIRYRRPEAPWSLIEMTVPNGEEAAQMQRMRLVALGYSVVDVSPSIPAAVPQLKSA